MFELNKSKRKILFQMPVLIGLLLCLCFSQGEGIKLLPFEVQTAPNSFDLKRSNSYQFSIHQQISGFNLQAKNIKSTVKFFSSLRFSDIAKRFSDISNSERLSADSKPKIVFSKFLQTASSDRSPPFKS